MPIKSEKKCNLQVCIIAQMLGSSTSGEQKQRFFKFTDLKRTREKANVSFSFGC